MRILASGGGPDPETGISVLESALKNALARPDGAWGSAKARRLRAHRGCAACQSLNPFHRACGQTLCTSYLCRDTVALGRGMYLGLV
jgi:hypothetical protein